MIRDRLLVPLLRLITSLLPEDDREAQFEIWLADCQAERWYLLQALLLVSPAWKMRAPYVAPDSDIVPVRRDDRMMLAASRGLIILAGGFALLFLITVGLTGSWTPEAIRWLLGAAIFVVYGRWLAWHGLDKDLPWLRSTSAGSAVTLLLAFGPALILALIPGPQPEWYGVSVLALSSMMAWDSYWGVRLPLQRRGVLRLFRRR